MEWRYVPEQVSGPYETIALEEVLLNRVSKTETPVLRFWRWKKKAVTIGRSQIASNEVDLELCRERNISVIRRPSGGGAMYHAPEDELVYSVIAPRDHFPDDITRIYRKICQRLVKALESIGVDARFVEPNSVFVEDKKVSGSAQKVTKNTVLQHGTLLYSPNKDEMFSVLKENDSPEKHIGSNISPVAGISESTNISIQELYKNLKLSFLNDKEHFSKEITDGEIEKAEQLVDKKYGKEDWNLSP